MALTAPTPGPLVKYDMDEVGVSFPCNDGEWYKAADVEARDKTLIDALIILVEGAAKCPLELYDEWLLDDQTDLNLYQWQAQRLLATLKGRTA